MADTLTVPGMGPVKQQYVIAGGALVVGIVGYAWWKRGTEAATAEVPAVNPDSIPETDRTPVVGDSGGSWDKTDPEAIDTNAKWTQAATEWLITTGGWEPSLIATALGKWLEGKGLTETETAVVLAAKGAMGDPPVGGPFPVKPALPGGKPAAAPGNFRVTGKSAIANNTRARVDLAWDATPGATSYQLKAHDITAGASAGDQDSSDTTHIYQPLFRNRSYRFSVAGVNDAGVGPYTDITASTP